MNWDKIWRVGCLVFCLGWLSGIYLWKSEEAKRIEAERQISDHICRIQNDDSIVVDSLTDELVKNMSTVFNNQDFSHDKHWGRIYTITGRTGVMVRPDTLIVGATEITVIHVKDEGTL